ncbi:MAG: ATP-binding protein [Chloroflexota bacterium]
MKNAIMQPVDYYLTERIIMNAPATNLLRRPNLLRYIVPLILFSIVVSYETWEHIILEQTFEINIHWTSEILFFGILGPIGVFGMLTYMTRLLEKQLVITTELETLNQTLEQKVAERTEELEDRNTQLAQANKELAQANDELKELDRLKSDFVSLVSHELRGPLTTLNGGLEVALQKPDKLPAAARKVLKVMARETRHLTDFVQTILDVSRLDAGILNLNCGPVAVEPFLHRLVETTFPNGNREILWNFPGELSPIWVDEIYFEKVISNLLTNAEKYSPSDSSILISVSEDSGEINITITDYGAGIPEKLKNRVFKRFQRLENRDRPNSKGWGLGLYFAKEIMEAHGGKISLQSPAHDDTQNPGSAFTLTVQVAKEEPEYVENFTN